MVDSYLARGRYAEQLERWLEVFPEEQLLVIPTEDLTQRPRETFARSSSTCGLLRTTWASIHASMRATTTR